jgi:hypothetical protein
MTIGEKNEGFFAALQNDSLKATTNATHGPHSGSKDGDVGGQFGVLGDHVNILLLVGWGH